MTHLSEENEQSEKTEGILIKNAGLVLCNPFLPRLFSLLELTADNRFKDDKCSKRAALILYHMLFGNTGISADRMLLNKILCGIQKDIPIDRKIELTPKEKETIQQMLNSMILSWGKLGQTSVKGLTELFFIRDGILKQENEGWQLNVYQKGYDVLLDNLPWRFSFVRYAWMEKSIFVKWR
ncbi:MAG: contractile injection system tape measure protein [Bacteroidales bacterium]|jgi:hypothetical protein|nr:contractile injection system tape measure protein [Bacteroidales bacterium]